MLKDLCFEIIQTCPNNCLFCSSCSSITKTKIIDLYTFKKTIDHFIKIGGIEEISISGGEPMLHPNIFDILKYTKDKNIRTVLFTSGIKYKTKISDEDLNNINNYLNKKYTGYIKEGMEVEQAKKLMEKERKIILEENTKFSSLTKEDCINFKKLGLDKIVFDFQALNENVYNEIMGTQDYLTYVIKSIIMCSSEGLNIDIHFIPTKINYKELPDIIEVLNIAEVNNLSILNFVPQGRGYENKDELLLDEEKMKEFIKIYNECKDKFNGNIRIGIPLIKNDTHLCTAGYDKLVIKYDGTVLPCPAFKEYPIEILNELGINTPNIKTDLDSVKITTRTREKPLCKELYKMTNYIK